MNKVNPDASRQFWTLRSKVPMLPRSCKTWLSKKEISTSRYFTRISASILSINYWIVSGTPKILCEHCLKWREHSGQRNGLLVLASVWIWHDCLLKTVPEDPCLCLVSSGRHSGPRIWVWVSFGERNSASKSKFYLNCYSSYSHVMRLRHSNNYDLLNCHSQKVQFI